MSARIEHRSWRLTGDRAGSVALPMPLSRRDVEKLRRYVEALAAEAAISWDDEDDADGIDDTEARTMATLATRGPVAPAPAEVAPSDDGGGR